MVGSEDSAKPMPVAFVGHGSPGGLGEGDKALLWEEWGRALPRPRSVLVVSAHWEDTPLTLGRTRRHDALLYDFWGFPDWLYRLQYPAPGAPELAGRVQELLAPWGGARVSDRALDHGAWMPLLHLFPSVDVPVLQISMPSVWSNAELYDFGGLLAPLRDEGVLILASGNLVHDIRVRSRLRPAQPPDYASAFDRWVAGALESRDADALLNWERLGPGALVSHPSPEHFRPVLVAAGAAWQGAAGGGTPSPVSYPVTGFEHSTVSRRCVQFG